jgi:hypothetical protein
LVIHDSDAFFEFNQRFPVGAGAAGIDIGIVEVGDDAEAKACRFFTRRRNPERDAGGEPG